MDNSNPARTKQKDLMSWKLMVHILKRLCRKITIAGPNFGHSGDGFPFGITPEQKRSFVHSDRGRSISQAKERRHFPHIVVSPKRRPCTTWHGAAQGHKRETIYDAVTLAEGVIYSLICCGNGQRIITCKILINVLQQQTSFAKLVMCSSAPDSEQLKWHQENKVLSGRTWAKPEAESTSGSGPRGRKYKWWVDVQTSEACCTKLDGLIQKGHLKRLFSQQRISVTVRRNKVFVWNKEKKIEDGCKLLWMHNSFLKRQHRKQRVKNEE